MTRRALLLPLVVFSLACGSTLAEIADPDSGAQPAPSPTGPGTGPSPTTTPPDPPGPPPPAGDGGQTEAGGDGALRFAALGDTGKGNAGQQRVADAVAAKCQRDGCDFVQLLGDNFYESGVSSPTDPLFQSRFEQPYAKVNAPFWVVLGNHDYGASGLGTEFGKGKHQVDYTARSAKWKLPSNYWRRTQGNVDFFGLDTNLIYFRRASDQSRDFAQWIPASTATWKIAIGHHPYRSNGPHGNAGNYDGIPLLGTSVKEFFDDNVCGKVDLYISGHDHSSQWLEEPCGGSTELAVAGAGAEGTTLSNRNRTRFETTSLSFLYVVVRANQLTAELVDDKGVVKFTRTLTKP